MQKIKKRGIILLAVFILIAASTLFYFTFFNKEDQHRGYFVQAEQRREISCGNLY